METEYKPKNSGWTLQMPNGKTHTVKKWIKSGEINQWRHTVDGSISRIIYPKTAVLCISMVLLRIWMWVDVRSRRESCERERKRVITEITHDKFSVCEAEMFLRKIALLREREQKRKDQVILNALSDTSTPLSREMVQ